MALPPTHNKRALEQWKIISKHIDFEGKSVLDLGCGYGDILFRCWQAGADIWAVESDKQIRMALWKRRQGMEPKPDGGEYYYLGTIESYMAEMPIRYDVIICFSVLPYLKDADTVLRWIKHHSEIALIECQYAGDGYGFEDIESDEDMRSWLSYFEWQSIKAIGKTLVGDRNKHRTIWLCR